ncbi:Isopropylmalate/homocitrate/citramalate synthases [Dethiosulfatibacter aminovorans DSM 17477]|uniref:Isopropylmalate/homocitrate/citramalate synthases n=1 Tax=Dethiosulfatibacter aminovorans DSM 17477 TaxID=1121476 RepID=A0A1M6AWK7_9FIRM|nr:pyruvate carboxyltransferase [Dethiosulfatibacter aminovorans]SHI40791.1 Isopropylmalate/homocitrate/citramalate synthases [Dethiosulfatibacter aminovorans DSM 17477]
MTKFRTEKWYTSPWNFSDEVTEGYKFAKDIQLHDVTLRDGEQQAGLILNADQKIRLAEKMAEMGIHRIEAGMPAVSKQDEKAIKEIVKRNLGPKTFAFGRCMIDDVKRAADCGVDGVVIEIPSNEELIRDAYKWELEKAIELSIKATTYAKEQGLYTVFFPIDMTRSNMDWVLSLIERVANEGHMDALAIVDTFGGLAPHTVPSLVRNVKKRIDKPIELHFHDDFGLGSANSIMGLAAGADVVHTTISASGERAGNASYEDIALSLLTMYGIDVGIDYSKIYPLSKTFRDMTGMQLRSNRGIFGDGINDIESGIVAAWHENVKENNPLLLSPFLPELVGHNMQDIVIGKHSGLPTVEYYLDKINIKVEDEKKAAILDSIKEQAYEKAGLLSQEDFVEIVKNA